jgi:hypothetical protein
VDLRWWRAKVERLSTENALTMVFDALAVGPRNSIGGREVPLDHVFEK